MGVIAAVAYVIYIVAAVLMVFAILLQEGKGGGLSALGGTQAESAFGATNPIRRMTVVLSVVFFVLAGFLSYMGSRKRFDFDEELPAVEAAERIEEDEAAEEAEAVKPEADTDDVRPGEAVLEEEAAPGIPAPKAPVDKE